MPAPAFVADSGQRYPRRDGAARRSAGCRADRPARGAAALVERGLSASLPGGFTAEVAYVGNRGTDILAEHRPQCGLRARRRSRPAGRSAPNTDGPRPARTPIPVKSQYNSLQIKVDRRMRGGLLVTNSYTFGRGYSYINGDGTGGTIPTPADIERSWQRTSNDSTHSFASSFLYLLPLGPDGRWMREGVVGQGAGRLAGDGRVLRDLGYADRLHRGRGDVTRARQQPDAQCERQTRRARRHRLERSVVRYVGLFCARPEHMGQRRAARIC